MAYTDRITEDAKRGIVNILNRIVGVEYRFIANYPRSIDQMVTIEGVEDQQLADDLERLGHESGLHLHTCVQLITRLGGTSIWQVQPRERVIDLEAPQKTSWRVRGWRTVYTAKPPRSPRTTPPSRASSTSCDHHPMPRLTPSPEPRPSASSGTWPTRN